MSEESIDEKVGDKPKNSKDPVVSVVVDAMKDHYTGDTIHPGSALVDFYAQRIKYNKNPVTKV